MPRQGRTPNRRAPTPCLPRGGVNRPSPFFLGRDKMHQIDTKNAALDLLVCAFVFALYALA